MYSNIYMVRFVSGHMPSTAIERNEGLFSSMEKAERWIRESYEICDESPGDDRLYIEKHPVDKIPSFDQSLEVKEIKVADLLKLRQNDEPIKAVGGLPTLPEAIEELDYGLISEHTARRP